MIKKNDGLKGITACLLNKIKSMKYTFFLKLFEICFDTILRNWSGLC